MKNFTWDQTFKDLFQRSLEKYRAGESDLNGYFSEADNAFLQKIGYKPREFFDFVEDLEDYGAPSMESAILIASVRRDYLHTMQDGQLSDHEISPSDLPGKDEELGRYRWLPRIIVKATAKLKGELDPDIMYSCGGDRGFLTAHDIHPADFLRVVWSADSGEDKDKILDFMKQASKGY
ncbi:MAG: hypothetical protein AAGA58_15510 [Verrucomicrobiota bacterium]